MTALCLIVNADDYGRSSNISRGIREAHQKGIVSSATCMMNFPTTAVDIRQAREETPDLGLGVHLVLTSGSPVLPAAQVASLIGADGEFYQPALFIVRRDELDLAQVKAEWRAQIERFVVVAGQPPTHLDAHHHAAYYTAGLFRSMLELAQEYGCAIRQPTTQVGGGLNGLPVATHTAVRQFAPRLLEEFAPRTPEAFYSRFYDKTATVGDLLTLIHTLPESGLYELMCHPGYCDAELVASSTYSRQRETELAVLTDPAVRQAMEARNIQLVTFAD